MSLTANKEVLLIQITSDLGISRINSLETEKNIKLYPFNLRGAVSTEDLRRLERILDLGFIKDVIIATPLAQDMGFAQPVVDLLQEKGRSFDVYGVIDNAIQIFHRSARVQRFRKAG